MGGGSWSSDAYVKAVTTRRDSGVDDFDYSVRVSSGRASGVHPDLDPKRVAGPTSPVAGKPIRESRDSDEHPESLPIGIIFDVTGSMGHIPQVLQQKLTSLMDVVIAKTNIKDPQVLVGAVGDSTCDHYPFQVGQFESDNRFDEQLRNIILEGGGGGQVMESYGLAYRFAAYHTVTDSFEKRGKKGYFFTIGDERFWPAVSTADVERIFGIQAEADESVADLLLKAQEKWEVFHLCAMDGSYPDRNDIHQAWQQVLGERYIKVDDSSLICEVIAGIINMLETAHDVDRVLADIGLSGKAKTAVKNALVTVAGSRMPAHLAKGSVPEVDTTPPTVTAI